MSLRPAASRMRQASCHMAVRASLSGQLVQSADCEANVRNVRGVARSVNT